MPLCHGSLSLPPHTRHQADWPSPWAPTLVVVPLRLVLHSTISALKQTKHALNNRNPRLHDPLRLCAFKPVVWPLTISRFCFLECHFLDRRDQTDTISHALSLFSICSIGCCWHGGRGWFHHIGKCRQGRWVGRCFEGRCPALCIPGIVVICMYRSSLKGGPLSTPYLSWGEVFFQDGWHGKKIGDWRKFWNKGFECL